ncbi:MAG: hypothetical protein ACOC89_04815 [Candidatus Saliniplasma sp.]
MDEKKEKSKKKPESLLIASYGHKYSEKSLERIKTIIRNLNPERVVILKIIKERPETEMIDAYLGHEEKEKLDTEVKHTKKQMADEVAFDIIETMDDFEIPYGVYLRTTEDISREIIDEFKRMNIMHVVIHKSIKGKLGKLIDPSITDRVIKSIGKENITQLD